MYCIILPIAVPPTIKNGGKQPASIKIGKSTFPIIAPIRPNIIRIETIIVLKKMICILKKSIFFVFSYLSDVGNIETVELTRAVEQILDTVTYNEERISVDSESFAK